MSDNTLNPLNLNLDENDLNIIDTLSDETYSASVYHQVILILMETGVVPTADIRNHLMLQCAVYVHFIG